MLYEFECLKCGEKDESTTFKKFGEILRPCSCGGNLERVASMFSCTVQANFSDGSSLEKGDKTFISQKYHDSLGKRKAKKSEETIAQERGEI